jgi:hypothetical protein
MQRNLRHALCLLSILLFAGCATTSTVARKSPEFNGRLSKLAVVSFLERDFGPAFAQGFAEKMTGTLQTRSVETLVITVAALTLDNTPYQAQMRRFTPNHVMVIRPLKGVRHQDGTVISVTFDVTIGPYTSAERLPDKFVWRATVDYQLGMGVDAGRKSGVLVDGIVSKLAEDQML